MSNTIRHRVIVDITPEGEFTVWLGTRAISCPGEKEVAILLGKIAKDDVPKRTTPQNQKPHTETLEEFLARGGKITRKPTKEETWGITLEDLMDL